METYSKESLNVNQITTDLGNISLINKNSHNQLDENHSEAGENKINEIPTEQSQITSATLSSSTNSTVTITSNVTQVTKSENVVYPDHIREIRLTAIGNVDSGKSTLVGCLTKNIKDDGRGYARQFVFNYQHEKENGRTSSIAHEIMGLKNHKQVEIARTTEKKSTSWKDIVEESDRIISIMDLCGHEKYLKTTMFGLTALLPDYAMILIGTNMGIQRMTKEHLGIVFSLNIPFFIVFTKIDIAPKDVKDTTISTFCNLLKTGLQRTVFHVKSKEDAISAAETVIGGVVCPIFQISAVTGEGIDELKTFISMLIPRCTFNSENSLIKTPDDKVEYLIDSSFNSKVGIVFAGILTSGTIYVGQTLMIGPTAEGQFKSVQIKTIHFKRVEVDKLECGNGCSVKLKSLDKNFELKSETFRKGMILLSPDSNAKPCFEFEIEALIVHHAATIKVGYQAVIHCHVVRQTATIVSMNKEYMRGGDCGVIRFRFLKAPEILHVGDIVLFREGRTRGKGKIVKLFAFDEKKEKMTNIEKKEKMTNIEKKEKMENIEKKEKK